MQYRLKNTKAFIAILQSFLSPDPEMKLFKICIAEKTKTSEYKRLDLLLSADQHNVRTEMNVQVCSGKISSKFITASKSLKKGRSFACENT